MRNSTAQHSTAQHSTAQHSTAQHSTAPYYANIVGHFVCLLFLKSKPAYGISIGRLAFL